MRIMHMMGTAILLGMFVLGCVSASFYLEPLKQERRAAHEPPANPVGEVVFNSIDVAAFSENLIKRDESIVRFTEALEIIFWSRGYVVVEEAREGSLVLNARLTAYEARRDARVRGITQSWVL